MMFDESPVFSVRKKKKLKTELKETHPPNYYSDTNTTIIQLYQHK